MEPRYPLKQWLADFDFLGESVATLPHEARLPAFERYYFEHYLEDPHSLEKKTRMVACWNYMTRHMEDFDTAKIAVAGGERSLLSRHLPHALYRLFAAVPMAQIHADFPVAMIIEMTHEQARLNPDA